jgi:hypothetical protein
MVRDNGRRECLNFRKPDSLRAERFKRQRSAFKPGAYGKKPKRHFSAS